LVLAWYASCMTNTTFHMTPAPIVRTAATSRQLADIKALLAQLESRGRSTTEMRAGFNRSWLAHDFTVTTAGEVVRDLISLLDSIDRRERERVAAAAAVVPAGRYAVPTNAGHLAFYEVWVARSNGYRGVSLQVSDDFRPLSRSASRGVLAKIAEIGALECAMAYGKEIGECGRCGRTLTNPDSIDRGIGPVCAGKF
jgi:hypothetical protein